MNVRVFGCLAVAIGCSLAGQTWGQTSAPDPDMRRKHLEVQKLELEIAKLQAEEVAWREWMGVLVGMVTGAGGVAAAILVAGRNRRGALDQDVHQERLKRYPSLVQTGSPLALYFPTAQAGQPSTNLSPAECALMGERMSCWYFEGGGLLMSSAARDSYFKLVRALTKAAGAKDLAVPTFPRDMQDVSLEKVHMSRKKLAVLNLDNIEEWTFGSASVSRDQSKVELHLQFKDYIFLQKLASQLRTELSFDLRSRRRPA